MADTIYKLTDGNNKTINNTVWIPGEWHEVAPTKKIICSGGWLHAYRHQLIASAGYIVYSRFDRPKLWLAEGAGDKIDTNNMKVAYTKMRIMAPVKLPIITREQLVRWAILCARRVCSNDSSNKWTEYWLNGQDRARESALEICRSLTAIANFRPPIHVLNGLSATYHAAYAAAKLFESSREDPVKSVCLSIEASKLSPTEILLLLEEAIKQES